VEIVDDQDEVAALGCELQEHSLDHRPPVEAGCRCWRVRVASGGAGLVHRSGVLAAADIEVFTATTTFAIMQSPHLDREPSGPVNP
jgi:hypothetical protein